MYSGTENAKAAETRSGLVSIPWIIGGAVLAKATGFSPVAGAALGFGVGTSLGLKRAKEEGETDIGVFGGGCTQGLMNPHPNMLPSGYGAAPPPMAVHKIAFLGESAESFGGMYDKAMGVPRAPVGPISNGALGGDLGGRAERLDRRCGRYERYYKKQMLKYQQTGKSRHLKKAEKWKAKMDACSQSGAYTPVSVDSQTAAQNAAQAAMEQIQAAQAAYLPSMQAQADAGASGSGGLPGGPIPWVVGGLAVLGGIAILATGPSKSSKK